MRKYNNIHVQYIAYYPSCVYMHNMFMCMHAIMQYGFNYDIIIIVLQVWSSYYTNHMCIKAIIILL